MGSVADVSEVQTVSICKKKKKIKTIFKTVSGSATIASRSA
jgi:hypothetical protein